MHTNNTVLTLTIDLLAHHAFNHLKDDEISALHHLILRLKEPLNYEQQCLLLAFWNHASVSSLPPALLQRCNSILIHLGRPPLEEPSFEFSFVD